MIDVYRLEVCSHIWIDPTAPPIERRPLGPIIGPGHNELKPGGRYRCNNCGATLDTPRLIVIKAAE